MATNIPANIALPATWSLSSLTADQFVKVLSKASSTQSWYNLGVFLGVSVDELEAIKVNKVHNEAPEAEAEANETSRCLTELYECLKRKGKSLGAIAFVLKRLNHQALADEIYAIAMLTVQPHPTDDTQINLEVPTNEYKMLSTSFLRLVKNVKSAFTTMKPADIRTMPNLIEHQSGLKLPREVDLTTMDVILEDHDCSFLNFSILELLVQHFLPNDDPILRTLKEFKAAVNRFKSSTNIKELATLIKSNQITPTGEQIQQKMVKLKVREFWYKFTVQQFETIVKKIFQSLYDVMTLIAADTKGCVCLNWIILDTDTTELLPVLPLELVRLIGVIYLHIGSDVIYNTEGEGCESIEAAMIQAIELKNTRAIELLLAVGCNPEVATYNGANAMTNIVNIRAIESKESSSSGSSHSVDHVCILGHNKHVEAIVDPAKKKGLIGNLSLQVTPPVGLTHEIKMKVDRDIVFHGKILYLRKMDQLNHWQMKFIVAENIQALNYYIKSELCDHETGLELLFKFMEQSITLNEMPDNNEYPGWTVIPHVEPCVIEYSRAASFGHKKMAIPPASCSFDLYGDVTVNGYRKILRYPLLLNGAIVDGGFTIPKIYIIRTMKEVKVRPHNEEIVDHLIVNAEQGIYLKVYKEYHNALIEAISSCLKELPHKLVEANFIPSDMADESDSTGRGLVDPKQIASKLLKQVELVIKHCGNPDKQREKLLSFCTVMHSHSPALSNIASQMLKKAGIPAVHKDQS